MDVPPPPATTPCCGADDPQRGLCCVAGEIDEGVPSGVEGHLGGIPTYIASPPPGSVRADMAGAAILFCSDIFGPKLVNSKLWCDVIARCTGATVYFPDLCNGDAMDVAPYAFIAERAVGIWGGVSKTFKLLGSLPALLPWMSRHGDKATLPTLHTALRALAEQRGVTRLGVAGFCWGGRWSLMLGKRGAVADAGLPASLRIACTVSAHPSRMAEGSFSAAAAPALLLCAAEDFTFGPAVAAKALKELEVALPGRHKGVTYPETEHGFCIRGNKAIPAVANARAAACSEAAAWFVRFLAESSEPASAGASAAATSGPA